MKRKVLINDSRYACETTYLIKISENLYNVSKMDGCYFKGYKYAQPVLIEKIILDAFDQPIKKIEQSIINSEKLKLEDSLLKVKPVRKVDTDAYLISKKTELADYKKKKITFLTLLQDVNVE